MKKWQIIVGVGLVLLGLFSLLDTFFEIDLGRFIFPLILIGLGLLIIFRNQLVDPGIQVRMPIIGDIRKSGGWQAKRHEIWWFVGTTKLDFSEAVFPEGEAKIKIFGFVNDVKILLPKDVEMDLGSFAFISEYHGIEKREERFFGILEERTENYPSAEKKVMIQINSFVADIRVTRV
jgi:predicted membrane protein